MEADRSFGKLFFVSIPNWTKQEKQDDQLTPLLSKIMKKILKKYRNIRSYIWEIKNDLCIFCIRTLIIILIKIILTSSCLCCVLFIHTVYVLHIPCALPWKFMAKNEWPTAGQHTIFYITGISTIACTQIRKT